jgi:P-type Ca2+ transporter type 2C
MNDWAGDCIISVKGALEKILPLCDTMSGATGSTELNKESVMKQADSLADQGYKVIAVANKLTSVREVDISYQINNLNFLGLIGLLDPLRPDARDSIQKCRTAGIRVAMVTGDHPRTSLAIARDLGLAASMDEVVSGPQLRDADENMKHELISRSRVFARVDPQQKYEIVDTLNKMQEFTAVTGDGANDAPALNAANVGIAMGKSGTDVAKETADLIITDDRFASIISGIEEGRIAYSNIRKVVYLLISTGLAELLLFIFSLSFGSPMPLTAIQILWLNLVTNGIQDKGLAFEPGEGNELQKRPRDPTESIFDRLMIERVIISAFFMGGVSFAYFNYLLNQGFEINEARNMVLLLMVLFENMMIANCRSEVKSAFALNPLRNPILLIGTLASQLIHIGAMYIPGLRSTLGTSPVSFENWLMLLGIASSIILLMELDKLIRRPADAFNVTANIDHKH